MAQLLSKEEKAKKKKASNIKKSLKKEIEEHRLDGCSSSDTEEIDFNKVIHPIGYFINDREQMIEEMFSIIKGEKLRKMLPPLLKNCSLEELKADCLVHLLGMSKKRVFALLEGRELNSSSDTESESDLCSENSEKVEEVQISDIVTVKSDVEEDDTLDISVSKNDLDALIEDKSSIRKQLLKTKISKIKVKKEKEEPVCSILISDDETDRKKKKILNKSFNKTREKKRKKHQKKKTTNINTSDSSELTDHLQEQDEADDSKVDKGKSLLEILELEMRARAIRALLKNTVNPEEPVPVSILNMDSESDHKSKDIFDVDHTIDEVIVDNLNEENQTSKTQNNVCVIDLTTEVSNNLNNSALRNHDNDHVVAKQTSENDHSTSITDSKKNSCEVIGKLDNENWPDRWAESKNVKEVMRSSQICANMRKRMRFARMLKQKELENKKLNEVTTCYNSVEESSVAQYNLLKSLDKKKNDTNTQDHFNQDK